MREFFLCIFLLKSHCIAQPPPSPTFTKPVITDGAPANRISVKRPFFQPSWQQPEQDNRDPPASAPFTTNLAGRSTLGWFDPSTCEQQPLRPCVLCLCVLTFCIEKRFLHVDENEIDFVLHSSSSPVTHSRSVLEHNLLCFERSHTTSSLGPSCSNRARPIATSGPEHRDPKMNKKPNRQGKTTRNENNLQCVAERTPNLCRWPTVSHATKSTRQPRLQSAAVQCVLQILCTRIPHAPHLSSISLRIVDGPLRGFDCFLDDFVALMHVVRPHDNVFPTNVGNTITSLILSRDASLTNILGGSTNPAHA